MEQSKSQNHGGGHEKAHVLLDLDRALRSHRRPALGGARRRLGSLPGLDQQAQRTAHGGRHREHARTPDVAVADVPPLADDAPVLDLVGPVADVLVASNFLSNSIILKFPIFMLF